MAGNPTAIKAEGRVGGVLRGGLVIGDKFVFHGPHRQEVPLSVVEDLKTFNYGSIPKGVEK